MNPADPLFAQQIDRMFDATSQVVDPFHLVVLDVDHAQTQIDLRLQILENLQFVVAAAGEFEDQLEAPAFIRSWPVFDLTVNRGSPSSLAPA